MSDRVFEIEFRTTASGNGAQQLKDDIDQIKEAVGKTTASMKTLEATDAVPDGTGERVADQMQKDLELVREKAAGIKTELADTAAEAGKLISQAGPLKNALTGLGQAVNGNPIGGLANSFQSFMSNSAGVAARVTAIGAAFAAGARLAYTASTTWAKAIADILLSFDPLMKGAADSSGALRKLGDTKLSLRVQAKAVEDLIGQFNELDAKSQKAMDSISRLESAQTKLAKAKIDNELQNALGATSDPGQQAALRSQAEKAKSDLDTGLSLRQADREIEALKGKQQVAEEQISQLLEDTRAAREKINTAENLIYSYAQALGLSYSEAEALAKDAKLLQERINAALASSASEAEKTAVTRAAEGLPGAVALRDEAVKSVSPADAQIGQLRELLAGLPQEIAVAIAGRETAAFEANTQAALNTQGFKTSLDELQQSLVNAKAKLDAAQAANSAAQTGGGDLSKTYPAMQAAEAEVQRIRQMISELSTGADGYTGTLRILSSEASEALSSGGTRIAQAGKTLVAGIGELAADSEEASKVLTVAAGAASGAMAQAITGLGDSVTNGFQNMANRVEGVAYSLNSRMSNIESRLAAVAADARSAEASAQIALSQVRNAR
jgi:hypothetical protein